MINPDDILDGIDFDDLIGDETEEDLDAILDSVADEIASGRIDESHDSDDLDIDDNLRKKLVTSELYKWKNAVKDVSVKFRDRWTSYLEKDTIGNFRDLKFNSSVAYQKWDQNFKNFEQNELFIDVLRRSCVKCKFSDSQVRNILGSLNSTSGDIDEGVRRTFVIQYISILKNDIVQDPNYDEKRFPSLHLHINNNDVKI